MKKISNNISNFSSENYMKFIKEKVLVDKDIIHFVNNNNLTTEQIRENLEKFYEYYIAKEKSGDFQHKPELSLQNGQVYINLLETEKYKEYRLNSSKLSKKIKTQYIPSKVLEANFSNLLKNQKKAEVATELIKICKSIIENKDDEIRGLYIYGPTGIGKTYLMGCIYNYLTGMGVEPAIVYFPEFVRKIKANIFNNSYDEYISIIREERVLIIDDIGAENITQFVRDEVLAPIINYREAEGLTTFFSSNLSLRNLVDVLSNTKNVEDQTRAMRIIGRIAGLADEYFLDGDNERMK